MRRKALAAICLCLLFALPAPPAAADSVFFRDTRKKEQIPEYVYRLLDVARGELGYTESASGYTKYGEWAGDPHAQWCAEFLCWCFDQTDKTYGTSILRTVYPYWTGTNKGSGWFMQQGRFVARKGKIDNWGSQWYLGQNDYMKENSYVPRPGDIVFYSIRNNGNTDHTALVEYVTEDGKGGVTVHVIEGNWPDKVQRESHDAYESRVLGYGVWQDNLVGTVLRSGNKGAFVRKIQRMLAEIDYLSISDADGIYGKKTLAAVRKAQSDFGCGGNGYATVAFYNYLDGICRIKNEAIEIKLYHMSGFSTGYETTLKKINPIFEK
ncbi:MAG: CHAP domain-containing protein [Eubacteriales bacterium]|nr:CHAP domain-containing protein [Eubacteriales bacterium]MDD3880901.1 CHAP domain-containing protein [Eubacteriales bacterium]MDD4511732.1 CHAP domain-containing protein [Eubacteriales bacterium]